MKSDPTSSDDFLGDSPPEEFGSGNELYTTGFIILGLLTFWIYTVWTFWEGLRKHLADRLRYFENLPACRELSPVNRNHLEEIICKGFKLSSVPKLVSVILYAISMSLIVSLLAYEFFTGSLNYQLDLSVVVVAAFAFCVSSIFFLYSVCSVLRNHEYHELLLYRLSSDPEHFRMVRPSDAFVERWNRIHGSIAFFLVLSIPITATPLVGVIHFFSLVSSESEWLDILFFVWVTVVLVCAAVFHLWGSNLLIRMFNDHLRVEAVHRERSEQDSKWNASSTNLVLAETEPTLESGSIRGLAPQRALAAIMITDMVGFSKEMEMDEETTLAKLTEHNRIIRTNIHATRGRELKTMGDAFLVRFNSAVEAVRAAIGIQKDFHAFNQDKEEKDRILIRIGVHIGDILVVGEDVIGNGVNVAARIEPLAEPGGICISADVYSVVKQSLDIKVVSIGRKELKNIEEAPEIYQIIVQSITETSFS